MTIRLALFGYGNMGRNWARVIDANPRAQLVGIVDPVLAQVDAEVCEDLRALPPFDAVVIATPTMTHYDLALYILDGPFPMIVEKPLATNSKGANAIASEAIKRRSPLAVGHVERFNPAVRALASLLAAGTIGDPVHVRMTRVGGYPSSHRGTNAIADLAVHDLDILRRIVGPLRIEHAIAHATVDPDACDTAEIALSSQSGVTATIHADWLATGKTRTIGVTGTKGAAFVDLIAQTCVVVKRGGVREEVHIEKGEPLALELDAFLTLVESGNMGDLCSGADGAAVVALAERALIVGRREWT